MSWFWLFGIIRALTFVMNHLQGKVDKTRSWLKESDEDEEVDE